MTTVPVYYLDEPLNEADKAFVIEFFVDREAIDLDSMIVQSRVATVLPTHVGPLIRDPSADIELIKKH